MRTRRGEPSPRDAMQGPYMQAGEAPLEKVVRETTVEIKNAYGLHLRPAMQFVDLASRFDCDITVGNGEDTVDGKSIMHMSLLAAGHGTRLKIRAVGPQAEKALEALRRLVEVDLFGEAPPGQEQQPNSKKR